MLDDGITDKRLLIDAAVANALRGEHAAVDKEAMHLAQLVALRMALESMRSHQCPSWDERVQILLLEHGVDVLPPSWVRDQQPVWRISCP